MVIVSPALMLFVSITFFIHFSHSPLSTSFIVIAMSFYMKLNGSLGFFFIKQIQFMVTANVSLRRIQAFLMEEDVVKTNEYLPSPQPSITLRKVWSSWTHEPNQHCLQDINIDIGRNELLAIVGPVGSGKVTASFCALNLGMSLLFNVAVLESLGKVYSISRGLTFLFLQVTLE